MDRVNGAHIPEVTKKTAQHSSMVSPALPAIVKQDPPKPVSLSYYQLLAKHFLQPLEVRLKQLVTAAPVMLFMKGTPEQPRCGQTLTHHYI